jgi:hypothetical protein
LKQTTPMSFRNRTGIQMSPADSRLLLSLAEDGLAPIDDGAAVAELRERYMSDADAIGSIPAPGTFKGIAKAGLQALTGTRAQVLLDKLGERMAFERSGVRLYEALIAKCDAVGHVPGHAPLPPRDLLLRICSEEAQHFRLVVDAIRSLGGDPTAETPAADLVGVETGGLMQVLTDPRTTLTQCLHAMLTAELSDNAGWELLMTLAESCEQKELVRSFQTALAQVHEWHSEATLAEARLV